MTQMVQVFQESNAMLRDLRRYMETGSRKPDMEAIAASSRLIEAQIKGINAVVAVYAVQSKNKRSTEGMKRMNIMDDTTAIDLMLGDPNDDKVKCPSFDQLITRAECLDISGSSGDDCPGCEIGRATREKLLPETEGR
jgi:hypothetical protein